VLLDCMRNWVTGVYWMARKGGLLQDAKDVQVNPETSLFSYYETNEETWPPQEPFQPAVTRLS
jgi:hypothetical protein